MKVKIKSRGSWQRLQQRQSQSDKKKTKPRWEMEGGQTLTQEPLSLEMLITAIQGPEQYDLREPHSSEGVAQRDGRHPARSFPN